MTGNDLTLMAVHAHPDDEVMATGGVLARYSTEGARTVVVTCTNGEQGDAPGGIKPGEPGHDATVVAALRLAELRSSVASLGVSHLELLGYRDSGMVGWATNNDPGAFCNVPLDEVAGRLADLFRHYRPQVVVSYDENGGYGHPDHIQVHRAAVAATGMTGIPAKFYYTAVSRSAFAQVRQLLQASGANVDELGITDDFGLPDDLITTVVDVSGYRDLMLEALEAHASQIDNLFFPQLPEEIQRVALANEYFRLRDAPPGLSGEDDLFAGLR